MLQFPQVPGAGGGGWGVAVADDDPWDVRRGRRVNHERGCFAAALLDRYELSQRLPRFPGVVHALFGGRCLAGHASLDSLPGGFVLHVERV